MKSLFLILILWLSCEHLFATTYFISAKGNDQNNGKSISSPWRSLSKVNDSQSVFAPGDSILFERGSVFSGTLLIHFSGQKGNEIYVGSYGSGVLPIVSGAKDVHNWKPYATNIWVSEVSAAPTNLFINGRRMGVGRYPNSGYLTMQSPTKSDISFSDNSLPFADGYWDNAEVVVKSSRWTIDRLSVRSLRNKTFTFASAASYPLPDGFGYFIQKHLKTLDRQGEWFYDSRVGKLYLYWAGSEPDSVEVSADARGLELASVHDVVIDGLDFRFQNQEGVILLNCESIAIRNVHIGFAGTDGLHVIGCNQVTVENCSIADSGNNGVEWRSNTDGSFSMNKIIRSGLVPGQGKSGNGTYIALSISHNLPVAGRNIFQHNTIDSTGYLGIDFRTGFTRIIENVVSNFCLVKDDGAGIYTWGNEIGGNVIEGNIVLNGQGSGQGTTNPTQRYAHGIYIDDRSSDVAIKGNTVAYCASSGIFIHNAKRLVVSGNTLFGNGKSLLTRERAQLFIKRDGIVNMSNELALRIDSNTMVSIDETTPCLMVAGTSIAEISTLGTLERNSFAAPNPQQTVSKLVSLGGMCGAPVNLNLTEWQSSGFDSNSSYSGIQPNVEETLSSNLIKNSTMASTEGWSAWPDQATFTQDKTKLLDGQSLRVTPSAGAGEVLLYHAGFALKADRIYKLSFMARSNEPARIQFVPMMAVDPYKALSEYACFSTDKQPTEFVWYFKPDMNFNQVRVNFKSNVEFWIDNVVLQESHSKVKPQGPVQLLFNATLKPIDLNTGGSVVLNSSSAAGMVTVPPFESRVVIGSKRPPTKP